MSGRMCTRCAIAHREDCRTCLGWGVYVATVDGRRTLVPVTAAEAHGFHAPAGTVYACPECDGGRENMPAARAAASLPSTWEAPERQR